MEPFVRVWQGSDPTELALVRLALDRIGVVYRVNGEAGHLLSYWSPDLEVVVQAGRAKECTALLRKVLAADKPSR